MAVESASPFDLPDDPEGQKEALTTSLKIVQGFALYFVVSEVSRVRPRLMEEMAARLPGKRIQRIHITREVTNLLHLLQERLEHPLPDIVFVTGFENVVSGAAEPRSHPLLLNLNATRNNLYALLPRPLVIWAPAFVLNAILNAAPDFISVRSGVHTFALDPAEREQMVARAASVGQTEILGFEQAEREARIAEMQSLLLEYRSLPESERNPLDEAGILTRLGTAYLLLGNYSEAEPLLEAALSIRRKSLPQGHPDIATSLNNLASLYESQGRYAEAEAAYDEALSIYRKSLPQGHPDVATCLNNLAGLYRSQGRYAEAEQLYDEALSIYRKSLPQGHPDIAGSLNNLAGLYESQDRYAEAEATHNEALSIRRTSLPQGHPDIANSLNNLAGLYVSQGRYTESETLYDQALSICRKSLPQGHPVIANSLNNLAGLYGSQGRYAEAETLFREALDIFCNSLGPDHPNIATVRDNLQLFLIHKWMRVDGLTQSDAEAMATAEIDRLLAPATAPQDAEPY